MNEEFVIKQGMSLKYLNVSIITASISNNHEFRLP